MRRNCIRYLQTSLFERESMQIFSGERGIAALRGGDPLDGGLKQTQRRPNRAFHFLSRSGFASKLATLPGLKNALVKDQGTIAVRLAERAGNVLDLQYVGYQNFASLGLLMSRISR